MNFLRPNTVVMLVFGFLLAKSEESWESPKQVKKKKKARRETWTSWDGHVLLNIVMKIMLFMQ